jgi:predicted negative regulator of RcsB-dependent stress response
MANGSPPSSRPSGTGAPKGTVDDAFTSRILLFIAWAQRNTQTLIIAVVAVVVLVVGSIWFFGQRAGTYAEAALQLEQVQQAAVAAAPEEAVAEIERYLARYGSTPYGIEARLVLAEIHLDQGDVAAAIEALRPVAPGYRDPLRLQATFLLAVAYEQAEQWSDAVRVYGELAERAEMTFQRQEATEGLGRAHLAAGDTAAAITAFRRLAGEFEEGDPVRGYFEMRLHELGAR